MTKDQLRSDQVMPVIFVGHGSPMNAIGDNRARDAWKHEGLRIGKPSALLVVSAHWMTDGLLVRRAEDNPQIDDFYGFPQALYDIRYAPKSSPAVADRVLELLDGEVSVKNDWGLDHGAWSVLCNMYPDADVPVVMLSTDVTAAPTTLFEIGKQLRPLRAEGIMILASGNVVHNLRRADGAMAGGYAWADAFDAAIRDVVVRGDVEVPVHYEAIEGHRLAIPTVEHYAPLLVALGAAEREDTVRVWNDYRELGSMAMTSYTFER